MSIDFLSADLVQIYIFMKDNNSLNFLNKTEFLKNLIQINSQILFDQ